MSRPVAFFTLFYGKSGKDKNKI